MATSHWHESVWSCLDHRKRRHFKKSFDIEFDRRGCLVTCDMTNQGRQDRDQPCCGERSRRKILPNLWTSKMSSFADAPDGDSGKGAKIFKTKCAQCHVAEKGGGHKQVGDDVPSVLRVSSPVFHTLGQAVKEAGCRVQI